MRKLGMLEELVSASALPDEMNTHTVGVSERYRRLQWRCIPLYRQLFLFDLDPSDESAGGQPG